MRRLSVAFLAAALGAAPQTARLDRSRLVDLTYAFDNTTIYWPTSQPFRWEKDAWGPSTGGFWYASGHFSAGEHGGTHIDSPIHFGEGKATVDEIPLSNLIAPAAVIDIARTCADNPDYSLTVEDITRWEQAHGRIPEHSIVLVRTGWGKFWPDKRRYLGSNTPEDTSTLHFPGVSKAGAQALVERKVDGVGIDTASLDHGPSNQYPAHQVLNGADVYGLENVSNLDRLPATGAWLIALPIKIKGGTGGPVRIVAVLPSLCAGHAQQLGGESPPPNLMEVRG
jgi:kynurenine formamidase